MMSLVPKLKTKWFLLAAVLAVMVPACCAVAVELWEPNVREDYEKTITIATKKGDKFAFDVELATDAAQQRQGLMFVKEMPLGSGMLFLFKAAAERQFWMKDTLIPLDIIFLEADGRIQHVHSMAKPQDMSHITSGKPSKAVLEINGGVADRLGIEAGDVVHHSFFNNTHLSPQ